MIKPEKLNGSRCAYCGNGPLRPGVDVCMCRLQDDPLPPNGFRDAGLTVAEAERGFRQLGAAGIPFSAFAKKGAVMTAPQGMPAGAELDRLVAEKVMGWKFIEELPDISHRRKKDTLIAWDDGTSGGRYAQFDPSVSIAHAWEVVEKMTEKRNKFWMDRGASGGDFSCTFEFTNDHGGIEHCSYGEGETAPLAICRAALKAAAGSLS